MGSFKGSHSGGRHPNSSWNTNTILDRYLDLDVIFKQQVMYALKMDAHDDILLSKDFC